MYVYDLYTIIEALLIPVFQVFRISTTLSSLTCDSALTRVITTEPYLLCLNNLYLCLRTRGVVEHSRFYHMPKGPSLRNTSPLRATIEGSIGY